MRTCPTCSLTLDESDFYIERIRKTDGLPCYRRECKLCSRKRIKSHRDKDPERRKGWARAWHHRLRLQCLLHYSRGTLKCACCGEGMVDFLTIDHVNNDGCKHRKTIGGASNICAWLKRNGFPNGFQVLCFNCNSAKGAYGVCPHQRPPEGNRFQTILDRIGKGPAVGSRVGNAILTDDAVDGIVREYLETDISTKALAKKWGVSHSTVRSIIAGNRWSTKAPEVPDGFAKERQAKSVRGGSNGNSQLSDEEAEQVLALCNQGLTQTHVAKKFNVHQATVWRIVNGRRFVHGKR